ncbi:TetR/AcrR family transcriptional regulator [Mangrovibacillus cuniculi]|uniref:TetR/AcrR family transcriptional regulator n=1 Tax=Mangrovibacillus cuniculi TaxID=2593652 RepID=A0A7S8HG33_9BACI|nr:TetR/AcrR family transcriptional regulator [Mangrovibacillus cuniculi]QPC47166.1 TetR/AcrR family transcriptional regulator [Mangrovibacillus cuniculi]
MNKTKPKYKQIIDAAVVVISDNGYHQAQVSKIAKQAGVADGTIYLYFKNKEDILISMFREKMAVFSESVQPLIEKETKAANKLLKLIQNHFSILAQDPNLAIVTQLELRQSNKEIRLLINEVLKEYLKLVDTILKDGMETGEFAQDLDVRLARQMIFGTIDETVTTWVMNEQKYDLEELAPKVHQLLLKACQS